MLRPIFPSGWSVRITTSDSDQLTAMEIRAHRSYLDIESLGSTWPTEDKSLELWAIAPGSKPVSLGVVFDNRKAHEMRLNLNAE